MQVAREWGLIPSQWDRCSPDDRARMMAHQMISGTRDAAEEMHRKGKGKDGKQKSNPHELMKKQMGL